MGVWPRAPGSARSWRSLSEIPRDPWQPSQRDAGLLIHPVPAAHPTGLIPQEGPGGMAKPLCPAQGSAPDLIPRALPAHGSSAAPPQVPHKARGITILPRDTAGRAPSLSSPFPAPPRYLQAPPGLWGHGGVASVAPYTRRSRLHSWAAAASATCAQEHRPGRPGVQTEHTPVSRAVLPPAPGTPPGPRTAAPGTHWGPGRGSDPAPYNPRERRDPKSALASR